MATAKRGEEDAGVGRRWDEDGEHSDTCCIRITDQSRWPQSDFRMSTTSRLMLHSLTRRFNSSKRKFLSCRCPRRSFLDEGSMLPIVPKFLLHRQIFTHSSTVRVIVRTHPIRGQMKELPRLSREVMHSGLIKMDAVTRRDGGGTRGNRFEGRASGEEINRAQTQ